MLRLYILCGLICLALCDPFPLKGGRRRKHGGWMRRRCPKLDLLTYNLGLLPYIPHLDERRAELPGIVSQFDADVICLQEAWYLKDVKTILEKVSSEYKYSYSFYHSDVGVLDESAVNKASCDDPAAFGTLVQCTVANCGGQTGVALLLCAAQHCGFMAMPQACIVCIALTNGNPAIFPACATPQQGVNDIGLLVLSKVEITNVTATRFVPDKKQILPRGHIDFQVGSFGRFTCTHLTANLGAYYFEPLAYGSFLAQQKAEIEELTSDANDFSVIFGDINTGPEVVDEDIEGEFAENYDLLLQSFRAPTADLEECTWCADNPLVVATSPDAYSHLIDHIFIRNGIKGRKPKRVFEENLPDKDYPLSDHYGMTLKIKKRLTRQERLDYLKKLACKLNPQSHHCP